LFGNLNSDSAKIVGYQEDKLMNVYSKNLILVVAMGSVLRWKLMRMLTLPQAIVSAIIPAAVLAIITLAGNASAQSAPSLIVQHKDWYAYSHQSSTGKICYILSVPNDKQPAERDHGDVYFMLSQHPGQDGALEPQFTVGYPFQESSKVSLIIDGKTFTMFTRGSNAWMENRTEEQQVIDAMRAGRDMSVSAFSRRGTNTRYKYSLSGVTASLNEIKTCSGS
jgi:invasion protein IalB